MNAMQAIDGFVYEVGEEVVVRLEGIEAYNIDAAAAVANERLPSWTIGEVRGRVVRGSARRYAVRFRQGRSTCLCVVDESAIEGTA